MVETIVRSNEQTEAPKNAKFTKIEVSNNVDYSLDTIDEQKFQEFKKMTDYIKEKGREYEGEYDDIMNRVIKPFEEKIQSILDRNKETKDLNSLSDAELNKIANERMEKQPQELVGQQELIRKINNNGSLEEIQRLNDMINENMADVQNFYNKIKNNVDGVTTLDSVPGTQSNSAPNTESGYTAPEHRGEGNSGSEGGIGGL